MIQRKVYTYLTILLLSVSLTGVAYGQGTKKKKDANYDVTQDEQVTKLHERLGAIIKKLKIEPSKDGNINIAIDSGYYIEDYTYDKHVYYQKAIVVMAGNSLKKVEIKYYQFNMRNKFRDVRSLVNNNATSKDMNSMEIWYSANYTKAEKFKVKDLKFEGSKAKIIDQYKIAIYDLIFKLERYNIKLINRQAEKIEKILRLGDEIR